MHANVLSVLHAEKSTKGVQKRLARICRRAAGCQKETFRRAYEERFRDALIQAHFLPLQAEALKLRLQHAIRSGLHELVSLVHRIARPVAVPRTIQVDGDVRVSLLRGLELPGELEHLGRALAAHVHEPRVADLHVFEGVLAIREKGHDEEKELYVRPDVLKSETDLVIITMGVEPELARVQPVVGDAALRVLLVREVNGTEAAPVAVKLHAAPVDLQRTAQARVMEFVREAEGDFAALELPRNGEGLAGAQGVRSDCARP